VPHPVAVKVNLCEREEDLVYDLLDSGLVEPVERDESEQIARGQRKDEDRAVGALEVVVQLDDVPMRYVLQDLHFSLGLERP
jgi:hypothetical protein